MQTLSKECSITLMQWFSTRSLQIHLMLKKKDLVKLLVSVNVKKSLGIHKFDNFFKKSMTKKIWKPLH